MPSPNTIVFNDPLDKETFRVLSNNLLRYESVIKSSTRFVISDLAKFKDCNLPLALRQKKVETIFMSLDPATQALQMYINDSITLDSLLTSTNSKTRQSTKYINSKRESIKVMSESLASSMDDLWHDFNLIIEVVDKESVVNIPHPTNTAPPIEERNLRDDLLPGKLPTDITPPLFEQWQESLKKYFYSGYEQGKSDKVFFQVLRINLNRHWRILCSDKLSENNSVELNIDIIRKIIYTSHPTFANLFYIFNIEQKNNESPSELLDRIRSELNSSNSPEVSIDNLNTIIAIKSLSDPILKDKLIKFKYENEHSNIEDVASIINKDISTKAINN